MLFRSRVEDVLASAETPQDSARALTAHDFKDFCFSIGTKLAFASVYHPQSNGVMERANGKIFTAVKKMLLDEKKGRWTELLPKAVWALNTTECRATGFTPFRLLYGSEAWNSPFQWARRWRGTPSWLPYGGSDAT